ncbi:MAG: hypothetical protein HKN12_12175, partial [Gemmatimonadetes bacterium]|nr:hypothetical protein [Gemmatimonadota bacterium]
MSRAVGDVVRRLPPNIIVSAPGRPGAASADRKASCTVRRARTFVGPQGFGLRLWEMQVGWLVKR